MSTTPQNVAATTAAALTPAEWQALAEQISADGVRDDIKRYADLGSRNIGHPMNGRAVQMLVDDLSRIGAGRFTVTTPAFSEGMLSNVEATFSTGHPSPEIVIVSAHLDSTAGFDMAYRPTLDPAPGADDDASGIAGVLAAARAVVALSQLPNLPPRYREIRFVLFNAEEREREGSRAYALALRNEVGPRLVGVYQLDMIGYDQNGDGAFELHAGCEDDPTVEAASLELADLLSGMVGPACDSAGRQLVPQVYPAPGSSDAGEDFSDHASFHDAGYPACLVIEDFFPGPGSNQVEEPNPGYHRDLDRPESLDNSYAACIARAVAAAVWYKATRN